MVLIWIIIWGFPRCLGTLKPWLSALKWSDGLDDFQSPGGVPGCIPFRLFIERHIGGRTYHVRIGVKRLKNMLGNTNSWSCAWYHFVGHIGLRCLEWLFVVALVGRSSIKGLLPDALLVQLPKQLLFAMLHVCMGHPILTRKNMGTSLFKASYCRWFQVVVSPSYLASWSQIRIFFTPGAAKTTKQKPILVPGGGQIKHFLVAQLPSSETSWCV